MNNLRIFYVPGNWPLFFSLLFCLLLLVCKTSPAAQAEVGYAANDCRAIVRKGASTNFKIIQMLKIGEEVEILESDPKVGWDKVRTKIGYVGWILHRFITLDAPADKQLKSVTEEKILAEKERDQLRSEVEQLRKKVRSQEALETELVRIRMVSKNALEIERQKENLSKKLRRLEKETARLADDNRMLERQSDTSFFLAGAAVLTVGLIGGAVLSRRRRTSPFGGLG